MDKISNKKNIWQAVVVGYREVIADRYHHEKIIKKYEVSPYFDEAKVAEFRQYFLEDLYPSPEKRTELEDAFASLNGFIKSPEKVFQLLKASTSLIFKYGRHLPKIVQAGFKALKSFQAVIEFETKIVEKAIASEQDPPFNESHINSFIKSLAKADIDTFVTNNISLFETLYDRELVQKIISIISEMILKMKGLPKTFSESDVKGLEIGLNIIQKGDAIFSAIPTEEQKKVLDLIVQIEQEVLMDLFDE